MSVPVEASLLEIAFRMRQGDFLLDVDLALPGRGISVFFGHSGSGKTSLLRCIAGLEKPGQGLLRVRGEVWEDSQQQFYLPTWKRPLGYVFQEASLFPHLNVRRNLEYGRQRASHVRNPQGLEQAVELLGIGHLLERMPGKLSGGERQRVAIARALAVCPQVLLMDEPLASLDPQRKQEILPFLTRLVHELDIPVLYVTHSPQEVTRLADHLVLLENGKVLASGPLAETLTRLDSPLIQSRQASSVLQVRVCGREPEYHLTQVSFAGGKLSLTYQQELAMGTTLRLRVYARDVSLALQRAEQTSILNVLPATITGMANGQAGQVIVWLDIGGVSLLSHITQKSASVLGLQTGMSVFAQIKASAIL